MAGWTAAIVAAWPMGSAMADSKARRQDLRIVRTEYVLKSRAFTAARRARALALLERLDAAAGDLSDPDFLLDLMKVAALAGNAHDAVDFDPPAWAPSARTPFRMIWFPEGLVVARAAPEAAEFLGARVKAIDGHTPEQILARLRAIGGGLDTYRKWNLEWVIENGPMLYTLGVAQQPGSLRFTFECPDGRSVERRISFIPLTEAAEGNGPVGNWSPSLSRDELTKGWRVATAAPVPLYLGQMEDLFRMQDVPDLDALYVQFRANHDEDGQKIAPFVAAVEERLTETPPRNLILDLRFDVGGDIDQTRELMHRMASATRDRIYLLVGRYTFSAGIASAAALKHDGGPRVRVVGEELADPLRWWSEIDVTCLPHSHICMRGTHGLWDLRNGCAPNPLCWSDRYDARVESLTPDIPAPLTATAWLAGRDPGMEAIATDLRASAPQGAFRSVPEAPALWVP